MPNSPLYNRLRVANALQPKPSQPGAAVTMPSGRMFVERIHRAMADQRQLQEALAGIHPHGAQDLQGNTRCVYDIAQRRLQEKNMPSKYIDVIEYLRTYKKAIEQNEFSAFDTYNHLSPLSYGMYHEKYKFLILEKTNPLPLTYVNGIDAWRGLITDILFESRSAYALFKKVEEEQWLVDNRLKRALLFILRGAIGVVFGAFGMGFLGNLVSGVVGNWMGAISDSDVGIFHKSGGLSTDAYWKTAVPDSCKGGVGDLGGWVRDKLFDETTPTTVTQDPDYMLEQISQQLQDMMEGLRQRGKTDVIAMQRTLTQQLRRNIAWALCFEKSKPGRPYIDGPLFNDLQVIANDVGSKSDKAMEVIIGCPFKTVNKASVKRTVEKIFWAFYIKNRFSPDGNQKSLGDPVIDRMSELGVGQRRTDFQFFWRSSDFEKEDQTTTDNISKIKLPAASGNAVKDRQVMRRDLRAQEGNIKYGRWNGGEQVDKQLKQWAETFLVVNPLEGELILDDGFCQRTAAERADAQAWQDLVDRYATAQSTLKDAVKGIGV